jgi:hypothetical protein
MPNARATVKQIDVTRAVKGAVAAGLAVARVEVDQRTGKIVIFPEGGQGASTGNEWDEVLR